MKVLVAVKRVVDYSVKVRIKPDETGVDFSNVKMSINPFCEIAVEEAIRLKEKGIASEVVVVSVGPKPVQEQIRSALAMGADRGIWIETGEEAVSSLGVARLLEKVADSERPGLVLLGRQSIDSDNAQTGPMLAALLDWPQATFASEVSVADNEVVVTREVDGGLETLALRVPAVVTADLRLNEPRYCKLPDIMKAKRKPMLSTSPAELGVELGNQVSVIRIESPQERTGGVMVDSVDALLDSLKTKARVL